MTEWWTDLSNLERVFWIVAFPFSIVMLIQLVMTFVLGDMDLDADVDVDTEIEGDLGAGFQFFTFKNLVAFFTIFGWAGIACLRNGLSPALSVIIAIVSGLIMMTIMAAIFYYANKLTETGSLNMNNALNGEGEVYLTIPKNKEGYGKIQIKVQGALRELEAVTTDPEDCKTGTIVKVVKVSSNNILTVTKNL
jgi:hypothetical protein